MTEKKQITTDAKIGKDVIESLTLGMYEDCRFIYREYVQNAADQVDKAVADHLLEKGEEAIHIQIDPDERTITVEDNATGIPQHSVMPILRNVAHSTKQRGVDKGFRGIGRLGGLGYCSKLTFITSYKGEDVVSIMTWDAERLKEIINDREYDAEAKDVLMEVTSLKTQKEDVDKHYFKVMLEGVTSDDLLDIESVREYLSMVAPVDIEMGFIFGTRIKEYMKEHGLNLDIYRIYVNGEQIFKPYKTQIYEPSQKGKKPVDEIYGVDFLMGKDDNGDILYWGWYTLSCLKGQMKPINLARGIRLRKENIQIGDAEICRKFFDKTNDQRFSFYFFGEIHAVSKDLIPNARRDYFGENKTCAEFEKKIKEDFLQLRGICQDASEIRSSQRAIDKNNELKKTIEEKNRKGYTSKDEKEKLERQFEEVQKNAKRAKAKLAKKQQEMVNTNSPLLDIIDKFTPKQADDTETSSPKSSSRVPAQNKKIPFRTDKPIYSCYSKHEKKLIGRIYASITNAVADERQREALISKIEEDITQ